VTPVSLSFSSYLFLLVTKSLIIKLDVGFIHLAKLVMFTLALIQFYYYLRSRVAEDSALLLPVIRMYYTTQTVVGHFFSFSCFTKTDLMGVG